MVELHFELMEVQHQQTKVALAEWRLRYLDYQQRYYPEKIATDRHVLRKWWARSRQDKILQQQERAESTQVAKCTGEDAFVVKF